MARVDAIYGAGAPLDKPIITRPGVMYRTSDWQGSAKWLATPMEGPLHKEKGDLSMQVIPNFAPRALTTPGAPWKNMTNGRR